MSSSVLRSGIPAMNFHVWQPCNMRCRYCFAGFSSATQQLREEKHALKRRALAVVRAASVAGIEKLTLVGGEPLLCPWLTELLVVATKLGMVTMVVSNGSKMDAGWISRHARWLKWAAISIDSLDPTVNRRLGRNVGNILVPDAAFYGGLIHALSARGVRTKVNTVVSALNWQEDFSEFLVRTRPDRWKILQALHIAGENDDAFPDLACSAEQFNGFIQRHQSLSEEMMVAAENNDAMTESYLMVDPLGRFFSNAGGFYRYSAPIWEVGWGEALQQVQVSEVKFSARGGRYAWGVHPEH